jgi:hypothetical protein
MCELTYSMAWEQHGRGMLYVNRPLVSIPAVCLVQPPKLIQRFTINLCHEFCQQNSLTVLLREENESQHVPQRSWE